MAQPPSEVLQRITERMSAGWTGRMTLNFKDGQILEIESAQKERLTRS